MSDQGTHGAAHQSDVGYEKRDANPWILGGLLALGMMVLGLILVGVDEFFTLSKEQVVYEATLKPESALLRDVRAREEGLLTSYGVVDSTKGIYRIPIERAIKLMADEAYAAKR